MSYAARFRLLLAFGLLAATRPTAAQTPAVLSTKIKVYLVGTYHFDSSPSDVHRTRRVDMSPPERQRQLEELTDKLQKTQADKVFIEWQPGQQRATDSTYALYRQGRFELGNSERYQIGYRLAKKLNRTRVYCAAAEGVFDFDAAQAYAQHHHQEAIIKGAHQTPPVGDSVGLLLAARTAAIQARQTPSFRAKNSELLPVFKMLNSPAVEYESMDSYLLQYARVGGGSAYPGADLAGDFFKTNVRIYTNLLRAVDVQHDKVIVLLIGQGHSAFLRAILQYSSLFEVAEVLPLLEGKN
jgi:hypothetical protein